MSMKSWTEKGYGFPLFNGTDEQFEQVKTFLSANCQELPIVSTPEEITACKDISDLDNIYDSAAYAVACALNRSLGVDYISGYASDADTGQQEMIGIYPDFPWIVGNLPKTEEEAKTIMEKAALLLGISGKPDYFEAEYYG